MYFRSLSNCRKVKEGTISFYKDRNHQQIPQVLEHDLEGLYRKMVKYADGTHSFRIIKSDACKKPQKEFKILSK